MRAGALIVALHLALVAFTPAAALAADLTFRWSDVRGLIVPGNVVGSGTGAVTGDGLPWSTTGGSATVNFDKKTIKFSVRGLVLAGGNSIGTRGEVTRVKGTIVCNTAAVFGHSALVDTELVPLDEQGAAQFNGNFVNLPLSCLEPDVAFLVRTAGGNWIAYGAVRRP